MDKSLININNYCIFTFISTSHALKAEMILKENGADFVIMPTLREISSSCGLSIKIVPENLEPYEKILSNSNVAIEEIYHIQKEDGKNNINKLNH